MEKTIVRRQTGDKTRATIIKAAYKLFAESGFSGTTTQAIAQAANVNETLIFHHFGSKAELWKQVKTTLINHIPIEPINPEPATVRIFLDAIVNQRLSAFQHQPDLIRLLQWQRLESKQDKLAAINILAPNNWIMPIQYLQKTKKIKKNLQPEIIMIWLQVSINAMIFDNLVLLQEKKNRDAYVDCLLNGFEKALSA